MSVERGSQTLHCTLDYHQDVIAKTEHGVKIGNQFVVTPFTVRQVIEYGLDNGWKPGEAGKPLNLRAIDDKIDLKLEKYKENQLNKK